jgi:hypothetical protein
MPSGRCFLSAASGLVVLRDRLHVIADDAHHLAVFDLAGEDPGCLIRLIDGDLPQVAGARKRVKPDFEILVALPGAAGLLALGSGSTPQRLRGVLIELPGADGASLVRPIDLQPLFAALAPVVPETNLEGAVLEGETLLLFNRGNMRFPKSHVVEVPLAGLLGGGPVKVTLRAELALPFVAGVPLTVTDACRLANGQVLLATVAEATADSFADGALAGAAIIELDPSFGIAAVHPLDPPRKVEGIAVLAEGERSRLLCVTDADDPDRPSTLLRGDL